MLHHDSADCTIDGVGGVVDGSIALNSWFILLLHSIHGMIFILQEVQGDNLKMGHAKMYIAH